MDKFQAFNKIRELNNWLIARNNEYEIGHPTVSDAEYDSKFFELVRLERETGIYQDDSITQRVDYRVVNALAKVQHNHKMLSLAKTKSIDDVVKFCKVKDTIAMLKMDGLTLTLKYEKGHLVSAETRGNGIEGEDVLHNALAVSSIPKRIDFENDLVVDGEIICRYDVFNELNENNIYSNPRNYAAGSIRLLNSMESKDRALTFVAWDAFYDWKLENQDYYYSENSLFNRLTDLEDWGFVVVPFIQFARNLKNEEVENTINYLRDIAQKRNYPIDGLVFKYEDKEFGDSLGSTGHHFNNAIAYKFYDEVYKTKLIDIDYDIGRTGVLTPVAVFEEVEIDGAIVSRASLHNMTILQEMLGVPYRGQSIEVFRSNMIIPQVYSAEHRELISPEDVIMAPQTCPICGGPTKMRKDNESEVLVCDNPECSGKLITQLDYFAGKAGLDIKGLSKATLEKLINWGWIENREDIFKLSAHRAEWINKPNFGIASVDKILNAIEIAKNTTLDKFISSLGIPLIGKNIAQELCKYYDTYEAFRDDVMDDTFSFARYDGFGEAMNNAIKNYNYVDADSVFHYLTFANNNKAVVSNSCENLKFVITGKLKKFSKREELVEIIKSCGGQVVGSVSRSTNYLINNDLESASSKNKTAKELNIPIITEEEFLEKFGKNS